MIDSNHLNLLKCYFMCVRLFPQFESHCVAFSFTLISAGAHLFSVVKCVMNIISLSMRLIYFEHETYKCSLFNLIWWLWNTTNFLRVDEFLYGFQIDRTPFWANNFMNTENKVWNRLKKKNKFWSKLKNEKLVWNRLFSFENDFSIFNRTFLYSKFK